MCLCARAYKLYVCVWCVWCENKIVKITHLLVSTVTRNSGNCILIVRVGCYDWMAIYVLVLIIIQYLTFQFPFPV